MVSSPIPNWIHPSPAAAVTIALCEAKLRGIIGWIPHKSDLLGSWLVWPRGTGIPSYCRQEETHIMCDTGRFWGGITAETHFVNETFPFYSKCHFDLQNLWSGCYNICDAVMACVKTRFRDWEEPQLFNRMVANPGPIDTLMDGRTNTHHSYVPSWLHWQL